MSVWFYYIGMKISSFFKILNRKINQYDKAATNPFTDPRNFIIVWVEDCTQTEPYNNKKET